MNHQPNNIRVLCASALAIAAGLGASTPVLAQTTTATSAASSSQVQEVVVTGSRIRGVPPVGSPLIAVDREAIDQSNAVTTTQLIQEVPQVFNLGVSETSRGQSGGSSNITYGTTINIRGIGPYATLIILNGHRAVPQGTSGFAVDPSVIPTIGLERVDVVADGSSAIYGSDAIAGVVNLILRRRQDGGEISVRYGAGENYDEHQIGLLWGKTWSTGQFTAAFENGYHSALSGRDRDFYVADLRPFGGSDFRPTLCNPGNIVVGGVSYAIPAGGVTPANASSLVPGTVNKCDNQKIADLFPEQDHNSFDFTFNQELNEHVSIWADGFAVRREFTNRTGAASSSLAVPRSNAFFVAPPGTGNPATETVQYSFINDYPQSFTDGYSQAVNVSVGADVKLPHDWNFGADYTWGRDGDLSLAHYAANQPALTAALASSNPATAFNPFGGANSAAVVDGILIGYTENKGRSIFQGYEAKFDGPLFHLPGGEVRAAFGYEGQRLMVTQTSITGTIASHTGPARKFTRGVNSFYGELLVPLVGADNAMPGIRSLDVDIAGRYDSYSDVGETSNPKIGVNWSPAEGLLVHGSWGTSFRAPTISQIYGNTNTLFIQNYSDPTCACIRQGVTRSGGNTELQPETATTWSIGADWAPTFLPNAKLSATYFDIEYENQVSNFLADLTILNREAQFAGTGIIVRNPPPGLIAQQVAETGFTGVIPNPATLFVEGRSKNLGVTIAKGVDFQGTYSWTTENWGAFTFIGIGTYYTEYKTAITPSAPLIDNNNIIFNPLRWKTRLGVRWSDGAWQANVFANYLNSYINNLTTPAQKVEDYASVDLHLEYDFGQKLSLPLVHDLRVGLDVRNAFDAEPPFVNIAQSPNGGGGWDPTLTNPVGRVVAISLGTRF